MRISTKPTKLLVQFEGFERLWAIKRSLTIPRTVITDVAWRRHYEHPRRLIRIGGTGIPARLAAGTFHGKNETAFLYLKGAHGLKRRTTEVLIIKTRGYGYDEIALSVPEAEGRKITAWWRGRNYRQSAL